MFSILHIWISSTNTVIVCRLSLVWRSAPTTIPHKSRGSRMMSLISNTVEINHQHVHQHMYRQPLSLWLTPSSDGHLQGNNMSCRAFTFRYVELAVTATAIDPPSHFNHTLHPPPPKKKKKGEGRGRGEKTADYRNLSTVLSCKEKTKFDSVQLKVVISGKSIRAVPHFWEISLMLLLRQFQCWCYWRVSCPDPPATKQGLNWTELIDEGPFSLFWSRSTSRCLFLRPSRPGDRWRDKRFAARVSQAPQHYGPSEIQIINDGSFFFFFLRSTFTRNTTNAGCLSWTVALFSFFSFSFQRSWMDR